MRILVFAAHPDDEILGIGGNICRHVESGDEVYVCIATKAYAPQWSEEYIQEKVKEQKKVDGILGIKRRFNLDYPTVKLNTVAHGELNKRVSEIVDEVDPDIVYTHFDGDINDDHKVIFNASLVATRPPKKITLICYETLSETEWGSKAFFPNKWVDIGRFIDRKTEAFKVYRSEVKDAPHPRSVEGIRNLAAFRGGQICVNYAEAFMIIREV